MDVAIGSSTFYMCVEGGRPNCHILQDEPHMKRARVEGEAEEVEEEVEEEAVDEVPSGMGG
jgi:hypothetical protein